jgi:hypothetical protein
MVQIFARHCRQGNRNSATYVWLLLAKNNAIETEILEVKKSTESDPAAENRKVGENDNVASGAVPGEGLVMELDE